MGQRKQHPGTHHYRQRLKEERIVRQAEAVRLRREEGLSTVEIARRMGLDRTTVWGYIRDAVAATVEEIREHGDAIRADMVERIHRHLRALEPGLEAGDPAAHRAAQGWYQQLAKLGGLNLQPDQAGPQVLVVDARLPWERDGGTGGTGDGPPVVDVAAAAPVGRLPAGGTGTGGAEDDGTGDPDPDERAKLRRAIAQADAGDGRPWRDVWDDLGSDGTGGTGTGAP